MNQVIKRPGKSDRILDIVSDFGNTDYVIDGVIYRNNPVKNVLVGSSSDLSLLKDYDPGTIAYTAGYQSMWQKDITGDWEVIVSGS